MTSTTPDGRATGAPNSSLETRSPLSGFGVIFLCFLLSGATGLMYQVIWLRLLGLVFGHTVYAITTVLAAFMGGLALGSFVFARRTARIRNLITAYGWLEIAIGLSCALIPALLRVIAKVYVTLHRSLGLSYDAFSAVQFMLVFALLLIPTTLMGGTLPVLSQALVGQDGGPGRKVGTLYSINTFGAVVGVVMAGYLLLPAFGNRITMAIAISGNVLVGAMALAYSRRLPLPDPVSTVAITRLAGRLHASHDPAPGEPAATPTASTLGARLTVVALGVSGAVSMVYEVCWTRAISLVIGSSTYAFTAMLVAFLVGIAGGSALYSWLWGNRRSSAATFAVLQVGIGAAAATLIFFERVPELFLYALRISNASSFVQLLHFVVSATSLLPFTLLIGATFPCAVAIATRGVARIGRDVGEIYAANTLGAIVGSVAAGFALVPALGVNASIKAGIAVNLLLAALLFGSALLPVRQVGVRAQSWRVVSTAVALVAAVGALSLPAWDQRVMSSGPAVYASGYLKAMERSSPANVLRTQDLLFYRDGRSGTVSVSRSGPHVSLRVNGKTDASTGSDMPTQLMSGHLPMLLHPQALRVLVIGMGSGVTAGAVLRHPVERLDLVEIEPAVLEASSFFASLHGGVLKDSRTRPIVADGRNYLTTTGTLYDVIISEPSNPWIGGLASLFSREFFQLAREHLRPGGLMVQWLQGYNLYGDDFRMIVNTFRSAFPHVTVWNTTRGDYLLLGSLEPLAIDLARLKAQYQGNRRVREDLDRLGLPGWAGPLGYFMLTAEDSARFGEGAGLNTDDRLPLEFSAPKALYADTTEANWKLLRSYQSQIEPPVGAQSEPELSRADTWYSMGVTHLTRASYADARALFERAARLAQRSPGPPLAQENSDVRLAKLAGALEMAQATARPAPENGEALYVAGLAAERLNRADEAVVFYQRALAASPPDTTYRAALERATKVASSLSKG